MNVFWNSFVLVKNASFDLVKFHLVTSCHENLNDPIGIDNNSKFKLNIFSCFHIEYLPSITVTGGNIIIPFMFTMLISLEKYSNKNSELFLNLSRCISLRLASLLVTLLSIRVSKPKLFLKKNT
jgi:hypothetical protein